MPVYEYQCPRGHVTEEFRTVGLRGHPTSCRVCGDLAEKHILHAPRVFSDYEGYESPASGKWVEGRAARREDFARTGTRPYEDGERAVAERSRRLQEEAQESVIEDAVMRTASELGLSTT